VLLDGLELNQVHEGVVRNIKPFGAFVDMGGLDGLVHISELDWKRVDHPSKVVEIGQKVRVKVVKIDNAEGGPEKVRIGLSMKAVNDSPWDAVGRDFLKDQEYEGKVVRLDKYGAFVQLAPGLDGLVHVSELSLKRVNHPSEVVKEGQAVRVKVIKIDHLRQRISLSMKALLEDPWASIDSRYAKGLQVTGTVENREQFGVFVALEPGVTGLLPNSEMERKGQGDAALRFNRGDEVTLTVLSVDSERKRLTLTEQGDVDRPRNAERHQNHGDRDRDRPRPSRRRDRQQAPAQTSTGGGLGTFGDLFADKFKNLQK
jgi:small subunit ribosomal protein S1